MTAPSDATEPARAADLAAWAQSVGAAAWFDAFAALHPESAVFVVDASRRVLAWRDGDGDLLGWSEDELRGEHCLKANRCITCLSGCGISEEHGPILDVELELYRRDGTPLRLRKRAMGFRGPDGAFLGGVEVLSPTAEAADGSPRLDARDVVDVHGMLTRDPTLIALLATMRRVAASDVSVLVRGESGTGKELFARAIHAESARASGPFVAVNCAALTPGLLESELFGHVRGAFTGAVSDRRGLFEEAHGGTLFLDEVGELPLEVQAKLLRVLEAGEVTRVGSARPTPVDVRIVAATHRSLRAMVRAGTFREDLMYRLRVVPLFLPALRERITDVPVLIEHFLARRGGQRRKVAPDAMRALLEHRWPGNVRELRNVVDYALAVSAGPTVTRADLPPELRDPSSDTVPAGPGAGEAARIRAALAACGGHVGKAAEMLGMSRPTFWRKRRKHGL
jgi:transcriptional regulator with PAS, ATPase and Fis domain